MRLSGNCTFTHDQARIIPKIGRFCYPFLLPLSESPKCPVAGGLALFGFQRTIRQLQYTANRNFTQAAERVRMPHNRRTPAWPGESPPAGRRASGGGWRSRYRQGQHGDLVGRRNGLHSPNQLAVGLGSAWATIAALRPAGAAGRHSVTRLRPDLLPLDRLGARHELSGQAHDDAGAVAPPVRRPARFIPLPADKAGPRRRTSCTGLSGRGRPPVVDRARPGRRR